MSIFINAQTKWSKCKFDENLIDDIEALDGGVTKEDLTKLISHMNVVEKNKSIIIWVPDEILSES